MHSEHKPTCVVVDDTFICHLDIDRLDEFKVDTKKKKKKKNSVSKIRKEDDFCNLVATYVEQTRLLNEIDNL